MSTIGIVVLAVAHSLAVGLPAASLIGSSMGSEGDITPYLLIRYFGLKRLSTLYSFAWTAYAIGGAPPALCWSEGRSTNSDRIKRQPANCWRSPPLSLTC